MFGKRLGGERMDGMFEPDQNPSFGSPYAQLWARVSASMRARTYGIWREPPAGDGVRSITALRLGIIAGAAAAAWGLVVVAALLAPL
jgi:hypothetical protein